MAVDYNELLYEKVQAEYDAFIEELKRMTPEQVIERAYEKVTKKNMVTIIQENELNALLNVDKRENEIVGGEPDEGDEEPTPKKKDRER